MKKTFKFMMMALAAIVVSASLAACSSNDDNQPGGGGDTPDTPTGPDNYLQIDVTVNDDLLSVADITVEYTAEDGTTKTAPVTNTKFEKTVAYKNVPSVIKSDVKFTLKENFPVKERYNLECSNQDTKVYLKNNKYRKGGRSLSKYRVAYNDLEATLKSFTDNMKFSVYK